MAEGQTNNSRSSGMFFHGSFVRLRSMSSGNKVEADAKEADTEKAEEDEATFGDAVNFLTNCKSW